MTLDTELARGPSGKLEILRGLCCRTDTAGHLGILDEADENTGGLEALNSSADLGDISGLLTCKTGDGICGGDIEGLVTDDIVLDTGLWI